jgi:hypothetical protein
VVAVLQHVQELVKVHAETLAQALVELLAERNVLQTVQQHVETIVAELLLHNNFKEIINFYYLFFFF